MELTRRRFIQASALTSGAALFAPRFVFSSGSTPAPNDVLVVIFQRGAMDCLQAIVPYADSDYIKQRPTIAIPQPGMTNGALPLDNFFGFHPSLAPILPLFQSGQLAVVHATGLKHDERSHFECQMHIESALVEHTQHTGWLNRHIGNIGAAGSFQAVGMGSAVQMALQGTQPAIGMSSIASFSFSSSSTRKTELEDALYALHPAANQTSTSARQALDAVDYLALANPGQYAVENAAVYPTTSFGTQLKEVAQLIKSKVGLQMACVDIGGWDHHTNISTALPPLLDELAKGLLAFNTDLGNTMKNVTVITMTEFGRRVKENASGGTDHGAGSAMFLMGGGVIGGQVYSEWPGLADANLFNGDLDITVDYRTVLNELMHKRCQDGNIEGQFPGFVPGPWVGCFRKESTETYQYPKPPVIPKN
ncbi:MAG: DUF1501 domain-containing protein [Arenimonas sp.]